jgi:predicted dithiol-disulfide oxidoreductase (DUF899 family)
MQHDIVSREAWLAARTDLLAAEKRLAEARAAVQAQRRNMPWTRVDKSYVFDTPTGRQSLADLFGGRHKLLVYHFMFAPEWQDGCPGCSQGADHFDGMAGHLPRLDATFTAISRAPIDRIEDYRRRKGWQFKWVSAAPSDFNYDYQVSFPPEAVEKGEGIYGFELAKIDRADLPGTSVFARNDAGEVFHVYSAYSNGGDMPIAAHYPELLRSL